MFKPDLTIKPTTYKRWLFRMYRKAKDIPSSEETLSPIPDKYKNDYLKWICFFKQSMETYVDEIERQLPEVFNKGPILEIGKGIDTSLITHLQKKTNYPVKAVTHFADTFNDKNNVIPFTTEYLKQIELELNKAEVIFFQIPFFQKTDDLKMENNESIILRELVKSGKDIVIGFHGLRMDQNGYRLTKELTMMKKLIKEENPNLIIEEPFFSNISGHFLNFYHIKSYENKKEEKYEYTKTR